MRPRVRAAWRGACWTGRRALTLGAGLCAAIPVLASTVHAARGGWEPAADRAIIVTRAWDVLSSHTPLVGQYSEASGVTGEVLHSPGPMLYWLLALPARYGSPSSLVVTMGVVNTVAIVASVFLARRIGGALLMFAAAVAIALMCQSLAAETFHDMWNPSAGLFPLVLLTFLSWAVACGAYRLLPVTALVASYLAQLHLMYVAPTLGLLAVAACGLAVQRLRRSRLVRARPLRRLRRRRAADAGPGRPERRPGIASWLLAAVLVATICWIPPIADQLTSQPGNLALTVQTATASRPTLGAAVGWHAVVRAVGVHPWWLYEPGTRWDRKFDIQRVPSVAARDSALAALAGLALVVLVGLARRRAELATAALIGLVLCAALAAEAAATPAVPLLAATTGYTMWWGSQVGMWVWLVLTWALVLALAALGRPAVRRLARRSREWRRRHGAQLRGVAPLGALAAALLGLVGTAAIGSRVAAAAVRDEHDREYRPIARIAASLDALIAPGRTVYLQQAGLDWATLPIKPAIRYFLVRHGVRVLAPGSGRRLGGWYELRGRRYDEVVSIADGARPPGRGLALAVRARFVDGWGPETVSVWMSRAPAARRALRGGRPRSVSGPRTPARRSPGDRRAASSAVRSRRV